MSNAGTVPTIPDGWIDCPKMGRVVEGTRFVPFKAPLSDEFDAHLPPGKTFKPAQVLSLAGNKIGMVIDLTKTTRYYNPVEFTQHDVRYHKIPCVGRGEVPGDDSKGEFVALCRQFLENPENDGKLIGVHCTHGFNRTGYMIVAYLAEIEDIDFRVGIGLFAQAREPGIYKQLYIDQLCQIYDPAGDEKIVCPPLPLWKQSVGDDDADDDRATHTSKKARLSLEDPIPDIPSAVYATEQDAAAVWDKLLQWTGMRGFPGAQPISLDSKNIHNFDYADYRVSWKADGTRYMLVILDSKAYFVDRDDKVIFLDGFSFPQRKNPARSINNTLVDGELVIDIVNDVKKPRFLIFDLVFFENQNFGKELQFDQRLRAVDVEIVGPRTALRTKNPAQFADEPFSIRLKPFYPLAETRKVLTMPLTHERDGLLFSPPDPYVYGRCVRILKWKPPELNTVDFLLQVTNTQLEGCLPESTGWLYYRTSGTGLEKLATISFPDPLMYQELNGRIIECRWNGDLKRWEYLKTRVDKSFPNGENTVKGVIQSIKDNITEAVLLNYIDKLIEFKARAQQGRSGQSK